MLRAGERVKLEQREAQSRYRYSAHLVRRRCRLASALRALLVSQAQELAGKLLHRGRRGFPSVTGNPMLAKAKMSLAVFSEASEQEQHDASFSASNGCR